MVKLCRAIPRNISFTSKRNIHSLYILNQFQTGKSYSTIRLTYPAANYFHSIVGHPKLCDCDFCLNVVESIKCTTRGTV